MSNFEFSFLNKREKCQEPSSKSSKFSFYFLFVVSFFWLVGALNHDVYRVYRREKMDNWILAKMDGWIRQQKNPIWRVCVCSWTASAQHSTTPTSKDAYFCPIIAMNYSTLIGSEVAVMYFSFCSFARISLPSFRWLAFAFDFLFIIDIFYRPTLLGWRQRTTLLKEKVERLNRYKWTIVRGWQLVC